VTEQLISASDLEVLEGLFALQLRDIARMM
jgi:hypothetical protein